MRDSRMTIWTIGHSTRTFPEFFAALQAEKIEVVADVRGMPGSRRYPQYDQDQLATSLAENGVDYQHFPKLGGRRKPKPDSANTVWRHPAFRAYADHMETEEFAKGIAALVKLAQEQRTAIMCAEAVWWRCHRSLISDYLKVHGWTALHIFAAGTVKEHPYTSAARLDDEKRLSYQLSAHPIRAESPKT